MFSAALIIPFYGLFFSLLHPAKTLINKSGARSRNTKAR
jgi:hypothetical protein